jgi:translation initiation factor IF-3
LPLKQIRLIDSTGNQVGIVSVTEALKRAEESELDLVEIAPNATPPVCKIINYGKFVYEQQKRDKLQKKKQQVSVLKEIRLHPNTDTHDFEFKVRHAINFIQDGDKVKVSVIFKGRELAYTQIGEDLLKRFIEKLSDVAKPESEIKFEGKIMHVILAADKSKKKNK